MERLKVSIKIAATFFAVGTLLFLIRITIGGTIDWLLALGFYYLGAALIINLFVLLALIVALIVDNDKAETLIAIGVILLNLPIAYFYATTILEHY